MIHLLLFVVCLAFAFPVFCFILIFSRVLYLISWFIWSVGSGCFCLGSMHKVTEQQG